jgi:hypothetical protein
MNTPSIWRITLSAEDVLKELRDLRTALYMAKGSKKLNKRLEDLTKTQAEVLKIFGNEVKDGIQSCKPAIIKHLCPIVSLDLRNSC